MSYFFSMETEKSWEMIEAELQASLKEEGFGILTIIDVQDTLKKKMGVEIPAYKIFGACNPGFAHKAIEIEPDIGLMLPCNVVVRELKNGKRKISIIDPPASMNSIKNEKLNGLASEVRQRLQQVLKRLTKLL